MGTGKHFLYEINIKNQTGRCFVCKDVNLLLHDFFPNPQKKGGFLSVFAFPYQTLAVVKGSIVVSV